jgi:hypothetical protein
MYIIIIILKHFGLSAVIISTMEGGRVVDTAAVALTAQSAWLNSNN